MQLKNFRLKNYYDMTTILTEARKCEVISFDIKDGLLLENFFNYNHVLEKVSILAKEQYGIDDFFFLRINEENRIKQVSPNSNLLINEIYKQINKSLPSIDCDAILREEEALFFEHIVQNQFMMEVFEAISVLPHSKKIFFISNLINSDASVKELLHRRGYNGSYELLSHSMFSSRTTQNNYIEQYIIDNGVSWLHIGNSNIDISGDAKSSFYYFEYVSPRKRYVYEQSAKAKENQEVYEDKLDQLQMDEAIRLASEINQQFTMVQCPSLETAVNLSGVSMMFNMSSEKIDNLKEYVIKLIKGELMFQEFWALKNINIEIKKGEKIGLIGLNGSGKSTILKIVSGVLKPTQGKVEVRGAIAPLIELGAGFDFNLSAKENVFLNGAILGYNKNEMMEKYDSIIEFAELKRFENVALKNFSSGMIARLGFAIATCHVPDILIIDEILSVGDYEFQKKCHKKMQQLTDLGATVLFVSHSSSDIVEMCDKAIWIQNGELIDQGQADYIVKKYQYR